MAGTEELLEAGNAFVQKLVGETNFRQLLDLKSKYHFSSIPDCIEWLLIQHVQTSFLEDDADECIAEDDLKYVGGINHVRVKTPHDTTTTDIQQRMSGVCQVEDDISDLTKDDEHIIETQLVKDEPKEQGEDLELFKNEESHFPLSANIAAITTDLQSAVASSNLEHSNLTENDLQRMAERDTGNQTMRTDLQKTFQCDMCGKCFENAAELTTHNYAYHMGEVGTKMFDCKECGEKFTCRSSAVRHRQVHNGLKIYECDICGKPFQHKGNLTVHYRVHTGERPFPCGWCKKRFRYKKDLVFHASKFHQSPN